MMTAHNSDEISNNSENVYCCDIISSEQFVDERGNVRLYGLALYNKQPQTALIEGENSRVDGITESYEEVLRLKLLIDELQLYPVHLRDVVEDYLS